MRILLALLLSVVAAKADWFGTGNLNTYFCGPNMTNSMNVLSNSITIAVWLRIRDTGTGLEQKNVFFSKGRLDFTASCNYLLRISGSKFEFDYTDQVGGLHTYQSSSTIIWTNRLRFVALTFTYGTAGSSMQMYLDGAPISGSWTSGNGNSNSLPNQHEFSLSGPTAQVVGGGILMGEQGPVMAWRTNLSSTQIQMLYKTRVAGLPYVIYPQHCVLNIDWSNIRYGQDMESSQRIPSRVPWGQFVSNAIPRFGQSSSGNPLGSQLMSFWPNE
jgi:hypothetical protein